jgi:hypothetical protein
LSLNSAHFDVFGAVHKGRLATFIWRVLTTPPPPRPPFVLFAGSSFVFTAPIQTKKNYDPPPKDVLCEQPLLNRKIFLNYVKMGGAREFGDFKWLFIKNVFPGRDKKFVWEKRRHTNAGRRKPL